MKRRAIHRRAFTRVGGCASPRRCARRAASVPRPDPDKITVPLAVVLPILAGFVRQPPRHRHGSKKAYFGPRIYNALRREALTRDVGPSRQPPGPGLDGRATKAIKTARRLLR